jgi:dienelactone hydrolase
VRLVLAAAGALILASTAAGGGFPRFGSGCARHDFRSGGQTVRAELCRADRDSGAAVVVLHGCGGFSTFDRRIVTTLPRLGISTYDIDFFGPTPPPGKKGFCEGAGFDGADPFTAWV